MPEITARQAREELARRAALASLAAFHEFMWPVHNPGVPLIWNWHQSAVCEHLEALQAGEIQKLLINQPPGHDKTGLISIDFPIWWWTREPETRVIGASYDLSLQTRINMQRRDAIRSERYRALGLPWGLKPGQRTKTLFHNTQGGWIKAVSTATGITGEHGNVALVDDPLKPQDVHGPNLANHVKWWREVLLTRFRDLRLARWGVTMQRLHDADLSGYLKESEPDMVHLDLPAEYDPRRSKVTVLGWKDPRTKPGELLFPERFPEAILAAKRRELGAAAYAAQYNQQPTVEGGNVFKAEWWRRWQRLPVPQGTRGGEWLISVDANFRAGEDSSYVAMQVWARFGPNAYLVNEVHDRMSFTETVANVRALARRYPQATRILIERKANGYAVIDTLKQEIPGVIGVDPRESKEARAASISPYVEAGNVWLPEGPAWVEDFVGEFSAFPRGKHDDRVDCASQALRQFGASLGAGTGGAEISPEEMGRATPARPSAPTGRSAGRISDDIW